MFEPADLRVFDALPADQLNTRIPETFVPEATPASAPSPDAGTTQRRLREQVFRGWPSEPGALHFNPAASCEHQGLRLRAFDFESQPQVPLRLFLAEPTGRGRPRLITLHVLDAEGWTNWLTTFGPAFARAGLDLPVVTASPGVASPEATPDLVRLAREWKTDHAAHVWFAPRGLGPGAWSGDAKKQVQIRRRFMLLGQTLDGMRVWDIRRALQAVRNIPGRATARLVLEGRGAMGVNVLYASLFEPGVGDLELRDLPASHREGPDYLNVLKLLDIPQASDLARARLIQNRSSSR
jgi:hypothetical protein